MYPHNMKVTASALGLTEFFISTKSQTRLSTKEILTLIRSFFGGCVVGNQSEGVPYLKTMRSLETLSSAVRTRKARERVEAGLGYGC